MLLYIAFTTIFQIGKDYKKALLHLVMMALLVNFSFPITRFIIDAGNVPMYYFADMLSGGTGSASAGLGSVFGASKIQSILIYGNESTVVTFSAINDSVELAHLLAATVFLFMFSITLLVLAVMFTIRLAMLVVLLIFASVGFVGSVIPGMAKFSSDWWNKLMQYVIYGPAAMLMLLISVKFFEIVASSSFHTKVQTAANTQSITGMKDFMSAATQFSIPIVMLWVAIGMSGKMSIIGAGVVNGYAQAATKWARRKTYNNPITNNGVTRGIAKGARQSLEGSKYGKFLLPKTWEKGSKHTEELTAGFISGGNKGFATAKERYHDANVSEQEKKMEEQRVSESELRNIMNDPKKHSKEKVEAAVRLLSKKDALRNGTDMKAAMAAMDFANEGNNSANDKKRELIRKAGGEIYKDAASLTSALSVLGEDTKSAAALIEKADKAALKGGYGEIAGKVKGNEQLQKSLDGRYKKEGMVHEIMNHQLNQPGADRQKVYEETIRNMTADDFAKQGGLHEMIGAEAELTEYLKKHAKENVSYYQESIKKMSSASQSKVRTIMPVSEGGNKGSNIREKLKEVGTKNGRR